MGPQQAEPRDWRQNRVHEVGEAFGVPRGPARARSSVEALAFGRRSQTARRSADSGRWQPPPQGERRQEPRVEAIHLVHVEGRPGGEPERSLVQGSIGRTLDLSLHGMRLELLDHALPARARLRLDLQLGNTILRLDGRVCSVRGLDGRAHEHGVEFLDLTPEQYETLDAHLHLRGD